MNVPQNIFRTRILFRTKPCLPVMTVLMGFVLKGSAQTPVLIKYTADINLSIEFPAEIAIGRRK